MLCLHAHPYILHNCVLCSKAQLENYLTLLKTFLISSFVIYFYRFLINPKKIILKFGMQPKPDLYYNYNLHAFICT